MFCGLTWISSDEPHLFFNLVKPEFLDANNSNLTQKCSYPVYQRSDCRIRFRTDIHFWFKVLQYYSFLCSLLSSAGHSGLTADYLNLLLNWCFFVLWSRPKTALIALKQMALKGLTTNLMFPWTCWEGGGGGGNWEKQTPFFSVFDCFKTFSLPVFSVFPVFFIFSCFFSSFPPVFPHFFFFFFDRFIPLFSYSFSSCFFLVFPYFFPRFFLFFLPLFFCQFFFGRMFSALLACRSNKLPVNRPTFWTTVELCEEFGEALLLTFAAPGAIWALLHVNRGCPSTSGQLPCQLCKGISHGRETIRPLYTEIVLHLYQSKW